MLPGRNVARKSLLCSRLAGSFHHPAVRAAEVPRISLEEAAEKLAKEKLRSLYV